MYISWKGPLTKLNPQFGLDLQETHQNGIPVPNYGNYGGPLNSGGYPVDRIDGLLKIHDDDIERQCNRKRKGSAIATGLVEAHATLFDVLIFA